MSSSTFIGFNVPRGVDKEVYRAEAEALGLSLSAYVAESLPLDTSGPQPVVVPRQITPEMVFIAGQRAGFLGTLESAIRGRLDGKTPKLTAVGSPPSVIIAPRDAARALLSRVVAGTLDLSPERLAVLEALRAPANN